jgi:uncharacterized membrane protein (DUF485 family)
MAQQARATAEAQTATAGPEHHPEIDWRAAAESPEFHELVKKRRSFVIPALGFVFVWYFGFIALAGYAPDFMGERLVEGFTVGYAFALSQFVMTWVLGWLYLRRADRVFDPLAHTAAERALKRGRRSADQPPDADGDGDGDGRRFDQPSRERVPVGTASRMSRKEGSG